MRWWLLFVVGCTSEPSFEAQLTVSRGEATSFTVDGTPGGTSFVFDRIYPSWDVRGAATIVATFPDGTTPSIALEEECEQHTFDAGGPFAYQLAQCTYELAEHVITNAGFDRGPGFKGSCACIRDNGALITNDVTVVPVD